VLLRVSVSSSQTVFSKPHSSPSSSDVKALRDGDLAERGVEIASDDRLLEHGNSAR
jgi:hypothetical protein